MHYTITNVHNATLINKLHHKINYSAMQHNKIRIKIILVHHKCNFNLLNFNDTLM